MATTIVNPERPERSDENQNNALNLLFARALTVNWELVAYIVLFILAIATRFFLLGERTMSHDESLHTKFSFDLYERTAFKHTPLMHGPILFHFTALSYWLFGVNDFSARIYAALLGVMIVMFPLLLRRWIGRTGAVLASLMLLVSPLLLYYNRYIRHDTPSILSGMVMFYAIMMYVSGPENQKRKAHWLYILAAAMLWNLGSKETAFIYIAIFGAFVTIYWVIRLIQRFYRIHGKVVFETFVVGGLLAGVMTLAMIVVISITLGTHILPEIGKSAADGITLADRLQFLGEQINKLFTGQSLAMDFLTFLSWTGLVIVSMLSIILFPAIWAYRKGKVSFNIFDALMTATAIVIFVVVFSLFSTRIQTIDGIETSVSYAASAFAFAALLSLSALLLYAAFRIKGNYNPALRRQLLILLVLVLAVFSFLIVIEERSHISAEEGEVSAPVVPGEEVAVVDGTPNFTVFPLIAVWVIGVVTIGALLYMTSRGWWAVLYEFPEFDVLIIMGTLILPWLTAFFIVSTNATSADYTSIGESLQSIDRILPVSGAERIGQFAIGVVAWLPLMAISIIAGLLWNWRRWLIASAIFHALFAFFFTTIFTNIEGLASGMIYSLQYWLEQQGVRRGNQPQYYYLTVIMPFYEFLPVIGGFLAMIAGMIFFWRRQRRYQTEMLGYGNAENEMALGDLLEASAQDYDVETNGEGELADEAPRKRKHVENWPEDMGTERDPAREWRLMELPFLLFVGFWGVVNLFGYTLAGEKMPWLGTHLTVPLIILTAWYFGRVFTNLDVRKFVERGWVLLLLVPFLFVGVFQLIAPYLSNQAPFQGTTQAELQWTYGWLAVLVVVGVILSVVYRVTAFVGYAHLRQIIGIVAFALLAVMTFRSAWIASFIRYDEATEFLVYAHAGPANKRVTEELADLSFRITDGLDAKIMYDDKFSWPGSWYMLPFNNAQYIGSNAPTLQQLDDTVALIVGQGNNAKVEPLVEDTFQRFEHIRMWWPIQDYFDLNSEDMSRLFDVSDANSGTLRRGLFDIWWNRDYSTYSTATNQNITLTTWPVSDRMYLYVRKDYAAQVWPYGIGGATVLNPFTQVEPNICAANWQLRPASVVFDTTQQPLVNPLGITAAGDRVYVAEDGGHRISIFTTDGQFVESVGQRGTAAQDGAFFERPHSVAVGPDGNVYVVDTWNYRVRTFTPDFSPITSWGSQLTVGFDAPAQPFDGFWGPRDIAVDGEGRVYISDTGNKRIRVYNSDGTFVRDIGFGGTGDGQLNEPAGIAIHPDGRLFVADTWNRRVAVFGLDGTFLANYEVRGWREELGNRPYLAVDPVRDLLYVTDPDAGRVLVYDTAGNCLGSFGQINREGPNASEFATIGGIAVDNSGNVYVVDLGAGRVLRFDPYERPAVIVPEQPLQSEEADPQPPFENNSGGVVLPGGQALPETTGEVEGQAFVPPGGEGGFPFLVNPPPFSEGTEEVQESGQFLPEVTPEPGS
ncbi:MAG: hypothetical protein OHK0046_34720 [Anaerolineae bacterium]